MEVLFHCFDDRIRVEDIIHELMMDTALSQVLSSSGHVPVTYGLWQGFWVDPANVQYDKDAHEQGCLMYVSIQQDIRHGGGWKSVDSWRDVTSETRCEVVEWLKTFHEMRYTHSDLEARHLFMADDGNGWKLIDWGKRHDRSVDEGSLWKRMYGDETADLWCIERGLL
ncbi:hypothetical protein IAR50_000480 [Cryptococcus sp. DSM 104548]